MTVATVSELLHLRQALGKALPAGRPAGLQVWPRAQHVERRPAVEEVPPGADARSAAGS